MEKSVLVFLAAGFEEVEALTVVDYLRRAGAQVLMVSVSGEETVTGSHGISVQTGALITAVDADTADALVLPGGMPGSKNLAASPELDAILRRFDNQGKLICAICAAPAVVLGSKGLLDGKTFTCYPGTESGVRCGEGFARWSPEKVVVCGGVITSRGPGTAGLFALKIIEALFGGDAAQKIAEQTLLS